MRYDLQDINLVDKKFQKEMNSGVAALILLGVLNKAIEPMYGYHITKIIWSGKEEAVPDKTWYLISRAKGT